MNSVHKALAAVPQGRYIVAVSGGVDSMALLDAARQHKRLKLIAAHFDHGMREDSHLDAELVDAFCRSHNITLVSKKVHLGAHASEESARKARYHFLQHCLNKYRANAILVAHHKDDVLETALINIIRGTGWRGLAPFVITEHIARPLVDVPKATLLAYARRHKVPWREDSTNADQRYLRNYIRHTVLPWMDAADNTWRQDTMRLIRKQTQLRRTIEAELDILITLYTASRADQTVSLRYIWCMVSDREGYELLQALCRATTGSSLLRKQAMAALIFARTARPGKRMLINKEWHMRVTRRELIVEPKPSVVS